MCSHQASSGGQKSQVGVPRRFSVGTLMVMVTMFAVLFAVLKTWNAKPTECVVIATFFFVVGTAQCLMYGGKNPRKASLVAGAWANALLTMADVLVTLYASHLNLPGWWMLGGLVGFLGYLVIQACVGAIAGYLAGTLTAGIFLWIERDKESSEAIEPTTEAPLGKRGTPGRFIGSPTLAFGGRKPARSNLNGVA